MSAPARALTPPSSSGRLDHFAADQHHGSADLSLWPPSSAELTYASALYHDPRDVEAEKWLRDASRSERRMDAVLRHVRKQAQAQGILARIQQGPL